MHYVIKKKFNYHSPDPNYDSSNAYFVEPDGDVVNYVWDVTNSYGNLSVPLRLLYVQRYPGWQRLQQLRQCVLDFLRAGSPPGLDNLCDIYAHNVDSYGDISNYAKPNNTVTDSCGIK